MDSKKLQEIVNKCFVEHFSYTPLQERIDDITRESIELSRFTDIKNLKEEAGDLLSSVIQLCNESGWEFEDLVRYTCEKKIPGRQLQYKSLGRKYKIALLGGSFNPITNGHIEVAKFVLNTSRTFDEVWLVPAYRHMYNKPLLDFDKRVEMCKIAAKADARIKVFEYEKEKNLAGETYHLIKNLLSDKKYENYNFSFIIGQDNANTFDKWVNYEELERITKFVIVPRIGYEPIPGSWYLKQPHIFLHGEKEYPIIESSSTQVKELLQRYRLCDEFIDGSDGYYKQQEYIDKLNEYKSELFKIVDNEVFNYIINNNLYNNH